MKFIPGNARLMCKARTGRACANKAQFCPRDDDVLVRVRCEPLASCAIPAASLLLRLC